MSMQILKSKNERQPEFNRYADWSKPQVEVSLDKKVEQTKGNILAAKAHDFSKWEDADGSFFSTYSQLLDYQTEKFIKRYPPNFARSFRPELVIVKDNMISWNKEAVRILKTDNNQWYLFIRNLDMAILQWGGFEGIITDDNAFEEKERILDEFALKLKELINNPVDENNTEN